VSPGSGGNVLEASGIRKSFRIPTVRRQTIREHVLGLFEPVSHETLVVLDGVDLEIRRGETLGIMGRNGSGKSTLLKILAGIYPSDGGSIRRFAPLTPILELGVGWNPDLDAIDNILLIATVMGMPLPRAREAVDEILELAEVERFARTPLRHFSSGMASRLAYSVAFHAVREVLVLDEIFAVGDAGFKARCEGRYRALSDSGHTVVLVSHDPRTVESFCSRALLLEGGRVAAEGSGGEVAAAYLELLGGAGRGK
jgi:ABC-type polysaccharide/polyol phosphate transport system ATPase subunit